MILKKFNDFAIRHAQKSRILTGLFFAATSGYAASGGNSTLAIVAGTASAFFLATTLLNEENQRTEILELKDKIKDLEAPSNDPK